MCLGGGIYTLRKTCSISSRKENIIGITGIVTSFIICFISVYANDEFFSVLAWIIPASLIIFFATSNTVLSKYIFSNRVVLFFGKISFEFFLWHQICIRYVSLIFRKLDIHCLPADIIINATVSIVITLIWRKIWSRFTLAK